MEGDSELLFAYARRGDVESLTALVKRHEVWLMTFLRGMLDYADAEDAFQQVWMRIIKNANAYRGGEVKSYLSHIARTVAIDILRKKSRHRDVMIEEDFTIATSVNEVASDELNPSEKCERRATIEDVKNAINCLSYREREIFFLRLEGEMTFQEIAKEVKKPLGTVLALMKRATDRLKKQIRGRL